MMVHSTFSKNIVLQPKTKKKENTCRSNHQFGVEGIVPIRCGKVSDDESLGSTVIPLKLAWAKLIHKSQGETYGRVIVKLPDVEFANGLTLVALSRA